MGKGSVTRPGWPRADAGDTGTTLPKTIPRYAIETYRSPFERFGTDSGPLCGTDGLWHPGQRRGRSSGRQHEIALTLPGRKGCIPVLW